MHGLFGSLTTCGGPVITGASANPNVLWPPNNKFVTVAIGYSVTDNCDAAPVCSLSVTAADSGGGINNLAGSSMVVDAHTVELRRVTQRRREWTGLFCRNHLQGHTAPFLEHHGNSNRAARPGN